MTDLPKKEGGWQEIIEQRLPDARKLELFARCPREGWTVWGNETEKFAQSA